MGNRLEPIIYLSFHWCSHCWQLIAEHGKCICSMLACKDVFVIKHTFSTWLSNGIIVKHWKWAKKQAFLDYLLWLENKAGFRAVQWSCNMFELFLLSSSNCSWIFSTLNEKMNSVVFSFDDFLLLGPSQFNAMVCVCWVLIKPETLFFQTPFFSSIFSCHHKWKTL